MKVSESEADYERAAPRPEPAVPTGVSDARFRTIATIAAVLGAFCVGASVYFLGSPKVASIRALPLNVWLGVGAVVFFALAWFVLKKLSPKLGYAKPGQGRWARVSAYVGFGIIALFGAIALHQLPEIDTKWFLGKDGMWRTTFLGATFTLRPIFFPAAAFFLGSMVGFHLFINRPRAGDFLIDTQGEMKRVSWPTRREWMGSTAVVLVLVVILSFFLFGVDSLLSPLMQRLGIGF